jgi:hypothetical protein
MTEVISFIFFNKITNHFIAFEISETQSYLIRITYLDKEITSDYFI